MGTHSGTSGSPVPEVHLLPWACMSGLSDLRTCPTHLSRAPLTTWARHEGLRSRARWDEGRELCPPTAITVKRYTGAGD